MMKSSKSAAYWIKTLAMQPHPEGGYYREVYQSPERIPQSALPDRYSGDRSFGTSIYFLVEGGAFSALHRIASDEIWHFYAGSPLTVYTISPSGERKDIDLGPEPELGHVFQAMVPAGYWFGSSPHDRNSYALVGCTVAPGFDFADFTLAQRDDLIRQYPKHETLIRFLTR